MDATILDEVRTAWPPVRTEEDRGYRRVPLSDVRPLDALAIPLPDSRRAAVAVVEGAEGVAAVPLVESARQWRLAVEGDGVSDALVALVAGRASVPPPFHLERLEPLPVLTGERRVGVDQTNRSVVVGEAAVVKWYTQPGADGSRAATVLAHLGEVGFVGVPRLHAALAWAPSGAPTRTIALIDELIPDARDGWEWCVDAVVEHVTSGHRCSPGCPSTFARDLGGLVGRLHMALATPSSRLAHPVAAAGDDDPAEWHDAGIRDLDAALAIDAPDRASLDAVALRLRHDLDHLARAGPTPVQPIHGDLHVGQVLRGPTGLRIIDFDGPPSGPSEFDVRPTAQDVAHVLVSLELVAEVARKRLDPDRLAALATWSARARASFLTAYLSTVRAAPRSTAFDERLIRPFFAQRLCRELLYAATILPRWRYAPIGALARLYPAGRT